MSVPVFANGDIEDAQGAESVLRHTGADGVMIGRAALGAPWLPGQIAGAVGELSVEEKLAVVREHVRAGHDYYGQPGVKIMRKHVQWYLEKMTELGDPDWRRVLIREFNGLTEADAQLAHLEGLSTKLAA